MSLPNLGARKNGTGKVLRDCIHGALTACWAVFDSDVVGGAEAPLDCLVAPAIKITYRLTLAVAGSSSWVIEAVTPSLKKRLLPIKRYGCW